MVPEVNAAAQPEPSSPTSTAKSTPYVDTKANSNQAQDVAKAYPSSPPQAADKSSKPNLDASISASPPSASQSQWPAEGFKDPHLSGHEPRYFPGMMARASRRDSARQGSMHDSDDVISARSAPKKGGAREEPS